MRRVSPLSSSSPQGRVGGSRLSRPSHRRAAAAGWQQPPAGRRGRRRTALAAPLRTACRHRSPGQREHRSFPVCMCSAPGGEGRGGAGREVENAGTRYGAERLAVRTWNNRPERLNTLNASSGTWKSAVLHTLETNSLLRPPNKSLDHPGHKRALLA